MVYREELRPYPRQKGHYFSQVSTDISIAHNAFTDNTFLFTGFLPMKLRDRLGMTLYLKPTNQLVKNGNLRMSPSYVHVIFLNVAYLPTGLALL